MLKDEPIIAVEGLSVRRGGRWVLRDLSVSVPRGDFVSVTGPNGAGKTTLLQCLLRLLPSDSGRVRIAGRAAEGYRRRELARVVGYVPQSGDGRVSFSVEEFVLLGRYPHWSRFSGVAAEDQRVLREVMDLTGTTAFAARRVSSLSGGERQKVSIAAALAQEAQVLLLDEPTAFLDPRHQAEICGLLQRLNRERGVTVLMVTHDVNLGALCANRTLALRDGGVAYLGPASGFMSPGVLEALYGVPFDVMESAPGAPRAFPRMPS